MVRLGECRWNFCKTLVNVYKLATPIIETANAAVQRNWNALAGHMYIRDVFVVLELVVGDNGQIARAGDKMTRS